MTTTLTLQSRTPLKTLSMTQQPQRRKSKRGAVYDEDDDGFKFTRGSKRAKVVETLPEPVPLPKPSRSKQTAARQIEPPAEEVKSRRRKISFSTPKAETKPVPRRGTRRSARLSNGEVNATETSTDGHEDGSVNLVGTSTPGVESQSQMDISKESTKILLPFSDTPVINRNKELRKTNGGRRRSSLGLRGRRASSLMNSGHSAIPHANVDSAQFYKHIEAEGLSEPRRMKQLLTWCAERALGPKPAHGDPDLGALLAARPVQEMLMGDFSKRSEMSDWFQRDAPVKPKIIRKPNPLDAMSEEKIKMLEERIKLQKAERDQWKALQKQPSPPSPLLEPLGAVPSPSKINVSLLDAEDAAILESLKSTTSSFIVTTTQESLRQFQTGLEFKVDQFADGVHKLCQARSTMDKLAEKVMALSAVRLEDREREEKEEMGTRDIPIQEVLRSLSRIMPDGRR